MGKKERHAAIMELIQQKELETQEDLIQALLEQGISVTGDHFQRYSGIAAGKTAFGKRCLLLPSAGTDTHF